MMTEDNIFKLKTLLNIKYLECLAPCMYDILHKENVTDYFSASLNLSFDSWKQWKLSNGIEENLEEDKKGYVKIEGVANAALFLPEELAEKVIILGFLP